MQRYSLVMSSARVDSRDVLDPNARSKSAFQARIVGRFERAGPNIWDDYRYVAEEGGVIRVSAGLKIHVEPDTTRVRIRRKGRVFVAEWLPKAGELEEIKKGGLDRRFVFVDRYLSDFASPPGWGLAAVVAKKLKDG
jgi:hypothetical protein